MNEQKAQQAIKVAWVFGIFSGVLTLLITTLSMSGVLDLDINSFSLFDVLLVWALAFGVYKKSRVCAVVLFIYFIMDKIYIIIATGNMGGIVGAIIFGAVYFQGIRGTIYYHKNKNVQGSEDTLKL